MVLPHSELCILQQFGFALLNDLAVSLPLDLLFAVASFGRGVSQGELSSKVLRL